MGKFAFCSIVRKIIGQSLTSLKDDNIKTRETDQDTIWHKGFYTYSQEWQPIYEKFIREFISTLFDEPFFYQKIPTFRVQCPGNLAVGEYHRDSQYGHPQGEVNFWLPLTPVTESSTVQIEGYPAICHTGTMVVFDAVNKLHGNILNSEQRSRVSVDFRILPVSRYNATWPSRSINMKMAFRPGEYYAKHSVC